MAVMDIDEWAIACLYGNNENEFLYRFIERDVDFEDSIIQEESMFWNDCILVENEPPYTENGDLVLESIRRHYGNASKTAPAVSLSKSYGKSLDRIKIGRASCRERVSSLV